MGVVGHSNFLEDSADVLVFEAQKLFPEFLVGEQRGQLWIMCLLDLQHANQLRNVFVNQYFVIGELMVYQVLRSVEAHPIFDQRVGNDDQANDRIMIDEEKEKVEVLEGQSDVEMLEDQNKYDEL